MKTCVHTEPCMQMIVRVLLTVTGKWKQPECDWINKLRYAQTAGW